MATYFGDDDDIRVYPGIAPRAPSPSLIIEGAQYPRGYFESVPTTNLSRTFSKDVKIKKKKEDKVEGEYDGELDDDDDILVLSDSDPVTDDEVTYLEERQLDASANFSTSHASTSQSIPAPLPRLTTEGLVQDDITAHSSRSGNPSWESLAFSNQNLTGAEEINVVTTNPCELGVGHIPRQRPPPPPPPMIRHLSSSNVAPSPPLLLESPRVNTEKGGLTLTSVDTTFSDSEEHLGASNQSATAAEISDDTTRSGESQNNGLPTTATATTDGLINITNSEDNVEVNSSPTKFNTSTITFNLPQVPPGHTLMISHGSSVLKLTSVTEGKDTNTNGISNGPTAQQLHSITVDCQTGSSIWGGEPQTTRPNVDLSQRPPPPPERRQTCTGSNSINFEMDSEPSKGRITANTSSVTLPFGDPDSTSSNEQPDRHKKKKRHRSRHKSDGKSHKSHSRHRDSPPNKKKSSKRHRRKSTNRSRSRSKSRSRSPLLDLNSRRRENDDHKKKSRPHHASNNNSNSITNFTGRNYFTTGDEALLIRILRRCDQCHIQQFHNRKAGVSHQKKEHTLKHCPVCFKLLNHSGNDWKNHLNRYHATGDNNSVEMAECPFNFCRQLLDFSGMYLHISKVHLKPHEEKDNSPICDKPAINRRTSGCAPIRTAPSSTITCKPSTTAKTTPRQSPLVKNMASTTLPNNHGSSLDQCAAESNRLLLLYQRALAQPPSTSTPSLSAQRPPPHPQRGTILIPVHNGKRPVSKQTHNPFKIPKRTNPPTPSTGQVTVQPAVRIRETGGGTLLTTPPTRKANALTDAHIEKLKKICKQPHRRISLVSIPPGHVG